MTEVTAGMTPSQFIAALNNNFNESNGFIDDYLTLTVLTTAMNGTELINAFNSNIASLNANAPNEISQSNLFVGQSGISFSSSINNNHTDVNNAINNVTQTNTIYVSNSGNDLTGDGSQSKPFLTLNKVSNVIQDSTKLYLERGSTFVNDKLDLSNKKNIIIDCFGSGDVPKLTGIKSVTGWVNEGGNIWSKQDNTLPSEITNIFIGGTKALLGRTAGWRSATGGSNTTLIDTAINKADGYYDNAELVIEYYTFAHGISRVSSFINETFTILPYYQDIENETIVPVTAGKKYFIQNHRNCLTTANTWAYNNITKTIYIYSTAEPENVTVTYGSDCIYSDSGSWITIKNLEINESAECGISLDNCFKTEIDAVAFNYIGIYACMMLNTFGIIIKNCNGYEINSDFVELQHCENILISDNTIDRINYIKGTGRYYQDFTIYGGMSGSGVNIIRSNNIEVTYNTFSNAGYDGIMLGYSNDFLIDKNYVHDVHLHKIDAGAIFCYLCYDGIMSNNICETGNVGNNPPNSHGFYIDGGSYNVEVCNNFVSGFEYSILCNVSHDINIHDNMLWIEDVNGIRFVITSILDINNKLQYNTFVHKTQLTQSITVNITTARTETVNNNKYFYPFGKYTNDKSFKRGNTEMTLTEWIADEAVNVWGRTVGNEVEITPSTFTGSSKPEENFLIYLINPAKTVKSVTAAELPYNDYVDLDGNAQTYPFNMQPYTSKILVRPT